MKSLKIGYNRVFGYYIEVTKANLDQIKDYAEKKLHMIYPKDSDVLLYQRDSDDYFRQYESVD